MIIIRDPAGIDHPNFIGEEGAIYFKYAYENGFWKAIIRPHQNYFSLPLNLITYLATLVPLKFAPLVTAHLGNLILLIPGIIVIFSKHAYFDTFFKKGLTVTYIMLSVLAVHSTFYSHFQLALAAIFVIFEYDSDISNNRKAWYNFVLFLSSLSAGLTLLIIPYIGYKLLLQRNKKFLVPAIIIGIGLGFQVLAHFMDVETHTPPRMGFENFDIYGFFNQFLTGTPLVMYFEFISIPFTILAYTIFIGRTKKHWASETIKTYALMIIFTWVTLFMLSTNFVGGIRYAFIPNVLFFVFVLQFTDISLTYFRKENILAFAVLFLSIMIYKETGRQKYCDDGTKIEWHEEVKKWEEDHSYHLKGLPCFQDVHFSLEPQAK